MCGGALSLRRSVFRKCLSGKNESAEVSPIVCPVNSTKPQEVDDRNSWGMGSKAGL